MWTVPSRARVEYRGPFRVHCLLIVSLPARAFEAYRRTLHLHLRTMSPSPHAHDLNPRTRYVSPAVQRAPASPCDIAGCVPRRAVSWPGTAYDRGHGSSCGHRHAILIQQVSGRPRNIRASTGTRTATVPAITTIPKSAPSRA
ncbi:hypothetical protein C8Q77DRAFT_483950 [Trametes polyzona]|nr:hypothetical protein C8Q77DRAFT_483950 [Trametes polyzona]